MPCVKPLPPGNLMLLCCIMEPGNFLPRNYYMLVGGNELQFLIQLLLLQTDRLMISGFWSCCCFPTLWLKLWCPAWTKCKPCPENPAHEYYGIFVSAYCKTEFSGCNNSLKLICQVSSVQATPLRLLDGDGTRSFPRYYLLHPETWLASLFKLLRPGAAAASCCKIDCWIIEMPCYLELWLLLFCPTWNHASYQGQKSHALLWNHALFSPLLE